MSPTTPLPASPGRREFPQTGDVLDYRELAELERLAAERAGSAVARRLPPYPGPVTDPRISLARIADMEARAVTEVLPVAPVAPGAPADRTPDARAASLPGPARAARRRRVPGRGKGVRVGHLLPLLAFALTVTSVAAAARSTCHLAALAIAWRRERLGRVLAWQGAAFAMVSATAFCAGLRLPGAVLGVIAAACAVLWRQERQRREAGA